MLLAPVRILMFLGWVAVCIPVQALFRLLDLPQRKTLPMVFHGILMRYILNIKVVQIGAICEHKPTLFACNHLSYLDITAIGSLMPCSFIAKSEVASWPLFGLLAKLQDTIFVKRRARFAHQQSRQISERLDAQNNMVLFAEGTSSDGTSVLPFKSSLLQSLYASQQETIMLQPVAFSCSHSGGKVHLYPWYGDMTLVAHLYTIMSLNGFTVTVTFLPPVPAHQFSDRKVLADYLRQQVASAPYGQR
jgi:1-acyl-sn-glycerol-3-phosphate acyltransferase